MKEIKMLSHDKCAAFEVVIEQQKKQIKNLEERIDHLENCVDEAFEIVSADEFSSMNVYIKMIDIFNKAELPVKPKGKQNE